MKDLGGVTDGRLFTARQAAENGLIDRVGTLRDAVAAAQKAAGIEKSHFITLPRPRTLIDLLSGDDEAASGPITPAHMRLLRPGIRGSAGVAYLLNLATLLEAETVLAALPYWFAVRR